MVDVIGGIGIALMFVMRTNKRRNLTSSQWAAIAAEAEDLVSELQQKVEEDRRRKIAERENVANQYTKPEPKVETVQLIEPSPQKDNSRLADSHIASLFNTNRTYISEARKLKETKPEAFVKVSNVSR